MAKIKATSDKAIDIKALWRRHEKLMIESKSLNDQLAPVTKEIGMIELQLFAAIKEGKTVDGITHVVKLGKSISWAKVFEEIRAQGLIPKKNFPAANVIIDLNSKETKGHKLEAE
jgi:hypothetical protein